MYVFCEAHHPVQMQVERSCIHHRVLLTFAASVHSKRSCGVAHYSMCVVIGPPSDLSSAFLQYLFSILSHNVIGAAG